MKNNVCIYIYIYLNHFAVQRKLTNHCKSAIVKRSYFNLGFSIYKHKYTEIQTCTHTWNKHFTKTTAMLTMCKTLWHFLVYSTLLLTFTHQTALTTHEIVTGTLKKYSIFYIQKDFGMANRLLPILHWFYLAWRKDPRALAITLLYFQGCYPEEEFALLCTARCILTCYKKIPHKQWELINSDTKYIRRRGVHLSINTPPKLASL